MGHRPVTLNGCGGASPGAINANFGDLHEPFSGLQAKAEASRCLYCYDAPCIQACPTAIDIPGFIHEITTGNNSGAAKTILSQNIMGGTCARACPTEVLCEQACVLNASDKQPVEIGLLQRHAVDHLMAQNTAHPFKRAASTGKTIAIVGAGPAGLSCAHRAAMLGHDVVVFEAKPKSGGLNEYGLAAYKMVDDFARREVDFLLGIGGIEIRHGQRLGDNLTLDDLKADHDSVFIGIGLGQTNGLRIDGEDMGGVLDAVDFIEALRQTSDKSKLCVGEDVIVIGAGNTAIDAAVQSKRLGAQNVTLVYRRGEAQMGATEFEIDLARTNGVNIRLWSAPVEIIGEGAVEAMKFEKMTLDGDKLVGTGKHYQLPADMVLKAIGQKMDTGPVNAFTIDGGKLTTGDNYQTSVPGIFAGGDCIKSGEDLTVQAVEDGKQAAHAIDQYLRGEG